MTSHGTRTGFTFCVFFAMRLPLRNALSFIILSLFVVTLFDQNSKITRMLKGVKQVKDHFKELGLLGTLYMTSCIVYPHVMKNTCRKA